MAMKRPCKDTFFNAEELERIRLSVVNAEANTAGEIAPMLVDASDSYREAEHLGAVLVASLIGVVVALILHHVTIWSYIPLVILLYYPALFVFRYFPGLKLPFVGRKRLQEAVQERALRAFYEKGLYRTKDETGVLIFISLLEHKVWILGDRGINSEIPPDSWQSLARQLATGIKENQACDALCRVISSCGEELSRHFPIREHDQNELSDELIR